MQRQVAFKDLQPGDFLHVVYDPNTPKERNSVKIIASVFTPTYLDSSSRTVIQTNCQTSFLLDPNSKVFDTKELYIEPWTSEE